MMENRMENRGRNLETKDGGGRTGYGGRRRKNKE